MISISGLTKQQVKLLDIIWNFPDVDQFEEWRSTLSLENAQLVDTLMELVRQEILEDMIDEKFTDAKEVLKNLKGDIK